MFHVVCELHISGLKTCHRLSSLTVDTSLFLPTGVYACLSGDLRRLRGWM